MHLEFSIPTRLTVRRPHRWSSDPAADGAHQSTGCGSANQGTRAVTDPPTASSRQEAHGNRSRIAPAVRMLVLALQIVEAVESGRFASYADAAQQLGLTRARVSQIVRMAYLARDVQEQLLLGNQEEMMCYKGDTLV